MTEHNYGRTKQANQIFGSTETSICRKEADGGDHDHDGDAEPQKQI